MFIRTWTADFEGWSQQVERLIDADDRVIALTRQSAVGEGSRARVELELGQVYEFEEGRLIRVRFYLGYADALEAAGAGGTLRVVVANLDLALYMRRGISSPPSSRAR